MGLEELLSTDDAAPRLVELEQSLMHFLPAQLIRLRTAFEAQAVSLDSLPERIRRDWVASDGALRLKIEPVEDLNDRHALERFIASVHTVAPDDTAAPGCLPLHRPWLRRSYSSPCCSSYC